MHSGLSGEAREPISTSELPRLTSDSNEILQLQSNKNCKFSVDNNYLITGNYDVKVLVTRKNHEVKCEPVDPSYKSKVDYIQPPFDRIVGFTFIDSDNGINEPPPEPPSPVVTPYRPRPPVAHPPVNFEALKQNIVKINSIKDNSTEEVGTGFIVGSNQSQVFIATALHVVKEYPKIQVTFYNHRDERFNGKMLDRYNEDLDFAIVIVEKSKSKLLENPLVFACKNSSELKEIEEVFAISQVADLEWIRSLGSIITTSNRGKTSEFLTNLGTTIQKASSGGPVFDAQGPLIGMITAISSPGNIVVATKINDLLEALKELGISRNTINECQ